jgi:tetratricopeptide (TPR) repeat protein
MNELDSRYVIEFSTDEPGALEALLTGGISIIANEALKKVFGDGHGWYCKITDNVTDLSECCWGASKPDAQEAAFRALKRKVDGFIENQKREGEENQRRKNEENQKREHERQRRKDEHQRERSQPTHEPSDADGSGAGCILKLILGGIAIVAILWFVFALAIPLLVIDIAAIALIAGLLQKNWSRFLLPVSIAGAALVVADYNRGWFTRALANNVPFLAGVVPVLLYINILAGLIAAYFLIRTFLDKRNPPPEGAGELTRRNMIAMGCLLLVGALTVGFQVRVDLQRRQALRSTAAAYPANGSGNVTAAGQPGTTLELRRQSKLLNAEGLRILSAASPDFNSAKRAFEQAIQLEPNNVEALNNLGYVYGKLGDYRSAEPVLIKVIDLAPTRKVVYGNLGEVQAKLGKTQDAANHFCQYVRQFDSLDRGKSLLAKTFNDPDPNVQSAVSLALANCTPAAPASKIATVIDPPSNIRAAPSAASGIICSVNARNTIHILGSEGNWYKTDVCDGKLGYIHRSQIKF